MTYNQNTEDQAQILNTEDSTQTESTKDLTNIQNTEDQTQAQNQTQDKTKPTLLQMVRKEQLSPIWTRKFCRSQQVSEQPIYELLKLRMNRKG